MNLIMHELIDQIRHLATRTVSKHDVRQVWAESDRIKFRTGDGKEGDVEILVNLDLDSKATAARSKGEPVPSASVRE